MSLIGTYKHIYYYRQTYISLQTSALLKMKEAQDLMERAQSMDKVITNKKKDIENKKNKIEKSIFKSTCQKAAKNLKNFLNKPSTSKNDDNFM